MILTISGLRRATRQGPLTLPEDVHSLDSQAIGRLPKAKDKSLDSQSDLLTPGLLLLTYRPLTKGFINFSVAFL